MALTPRQRLRRIAVRTLITLVVIGVPMGIYYHRAYSHLRRAVTLLNAGKDMEARGQLEAHLAANPKDIATRVEYARLLEGDRDFEGVLRLLDAAPDLDTRGGDAGDRARASLIDALLELGRPDDADARLGRFEARGRSPGLVAARVRVDRARKRNAEAAAALEAGIRDFPDDLPLSLLDAEIRAQDGDLGAAAARLNALADAREGAERAAVLTALGKLYRENGQYAQAELTLKRALAEQGDSVEAHYEIGQLYLYLGRNDEALAHVRRVIALDPRAHLLAYHIAGRAAVMLKDWETAEGMFRRLGELSARHANLARDDLALLRRTRLQERDIPSDRMITVRFRVRGSDAVRPKRLSIAGSWTDDGHYDDLRGWKWRPMEREADGTWTASAQMRVFSPFGYGFVLDDDEDPTTGALYDDRLMFHEMETIPEEVTVDVALTPDRVQPPVHRAPWVQRPADGRRSVFVFWLDSGCWPDLKPILMKGQAPAIAQFLDGAAHGSLWAEKALTAKALQALTGFNRLDHYTLLNLTTDLVREMQANAAVGNYFDFVRPTTLDWLDGQETLTIWDVVQRNRRVGLNLIFSDQAAFDPNDALLLTAEGERVALRDRMAPVVVEEGEDWRTILARILGRPVADASQGWMERFILINYRDALRKHRTAMEAIRAFRPEIAVVRYPELDHMSHQFFDGRQERIPGEEGAAAPRPYARVLENFYKFNDELLSEALALTDEDDAVFLISDHGILNNFVHAPVALLMARGSGIEASGFVGRHDNHDFPLTLMRLLGVEVPERPRYRAIDALLEAPEAPPTGP